MRQPDTLSLLCLLKQAENDLVYTRTYYHQYIQIILYSLVLMRTLSFSPFATDFFCFFAFATDFLFCLAFCGADHYRRYRTVHVYFQTPPYLSQLFSAPSTHYNTRSSSSSQLNLPTTRTSFGQKAFSFAGASLWRSLPPDIRTLADYKAFTNRCYDFFSNVD